MENDKQQPPAGTSPERTQEFNRQQRDPKATLSGGDPKIAAMLRSFGFDPDKPTLSDEDSAKMPPPTPRVEPYDSSR